MPEAPQLDQRRLLDLQALDTQLAKLAHTKRSHPTIAALAELDGRAADLHRAGVLQTSQVGDLRRALTKAEDDVAQVRTRRERDQQRLDSGAFDAKTSQAVTAELVSLARRQSDLEDIELEAMEALEAAEAELASIREQESAIDADVARLTAERDDALAELTRQEEEIAGRRAVAAGGIDSALVALYEKVRSQNSGLAVLAVRGSTTEPVRLDLSLSEVAAIKAAGPNQILRDEEHGYILVRLDD